MKNFKLTGIVLFLISILFIGCSKDEVDVTGTIFGKVTDAQTGEPLSGATITLTPGGKSRTTGSDGTFEFLELDPEQYEIQAVKSDYTTNSKRITVVAGRSASGDLALTPVVKNAKLELSVSSLNFGKTNTSLSFDVKNIGNDKFNWNISGLNNVDWLEVSPATGTLEAGKSNAVKVTVLRDKLIEDSETTIIVNADKESVSLKITAEVQTISSKIELSPESLEFDMTHSSLTFDIKNIGNSGAVNWTISGVDVEWITVAPMSGSTDTGKTSAVKVDLDRSKFTGDVSTHILVNADGESLPIAISAKEAPQRTLEVSPSALAIGTADSGTLTLLSHNGPTAYELRTKEPASWVSFSKSSGVIPEYDSSNSGTIETVELIINREGLSAGNYDCTLLVCTDLEDKEVLVTMTVEEKPRRLEVYPTTIDFGSGDLESFLIYSYNGATTYQLYTRGDAGWLSFSQTQGTIPAYNPDDTDTIEYIEVIADRSGLAAGQYTCTLIIRSDLGDLEVPVSMTVNKGTEPEVPTGTVTSCDSRIAVEITGCRMSGTTAVFEYSITNNGPDIANFDITKNGCLVYDDLGNQYDVNYQTKVYYELGSQKAFDGWSRLRLPIPGGVKINGIIKVMNVPDEVTAFNNITLKCANYASSWSLDSDKIIFKNVGIKR